MNVLKSLLLGGAVLIFCYSGMAQNVEDDFFRLTKQKSGHYTFSASINNIEETDIMLESGIHVMLIDSTFAFNNHELLNLSPTANDKTEKMNLGGKIYRITHKAKGKLNIGRNTSYQGEIFILSDYAKNRTYNIAIPIQNLYNSKDRSSRIVKLDLNNLFIKMISRKTLKQEEWEAKVKMNLDTYLNMPAVRTDLKIIDGVKERRLNGNFNIDLGNASFIFLFNKSKRIQEFLMANSDMKMQKAYNKKKEVVAEAIVAKECQLLNLQFDNSVIAITKQLNRFTTEGCIGLKFLEKTVAVFDFDKSRLYLKRN